MWDSDSLKITQARLKGSCIGLKWIAAGDIIGQMLIMRGASAEGFVARTPRVGAAWQVIGLPKDCIGGPRWRTRHWPVLMTIADVRDDNGDDDEAGDDDGHDDDDDDDDAVMMAAMTMMKVPLLASAMKNGRIPY